ncbi:hypothetical protein SM907_09705 [Klebsiella aerogenes]|uniref:hypothetical protein n=1 Tax=Klebsiella aerogenes TaxID=548 RepID=UPI0012DC3707|nr:hypothetical protein [Klebsiella aerogenes]WPS10225.1 hypothetical protein SM907_09705 [Klebsiella aerogenes]
MAGHSPSTIESFPDGLFDYLQVYDSNVEPSGTRIDMMYHAWSNYNLTMNNPNLDSKARKNLKMTDFDFLDVIEYPWLTTQGKEEQRVLDRQNATIEEGNRRREEIKKRIEERKNGKK